MHALGKHSAPEPDLGSVIIFSAAGTMVLSRAFITPYLLRPSVSSSLYQPLVCILSL